MTNQDFYVHLVEEKINKAIASLQAIPSLSWAHFDFRPFLQPVTQANKK